MDFFEFCYTVWLLEYVFDGGKPMMTPRARVIKGNSSDRRLK